MENVDIKGVVREKYARIARTSDAGGCCGSTNSGCATDSLVNEDYPALQGYEPDADLKLGCGIPTKHAAIRPGDTVLDLGSGAGIDAFVARSIVGDTGHVIGLDMTEGMIDRARENVAKLGYENVSFILGDIEDMPIADDTIDVVISNCVLNLVPNKRKAFSEIYRVLKPGGHFCVSDIVVEGEFTDELRSVAELYAGCVSGAENLPRYLQIIDAAGFEAVTIPTKREIHLPDEMLREYLDEQALADFRQADNRLLSVTVKGRK